MGINAYATRCGRGRCHARLEHQELIGTLSQIASPTDEAETIPRPSCAC